MTVFVIAQFKIHDREMYDRYQARFMDVFKPFGGKILVATESPKVVEGDWAATKVVMLSFPDERAWRAWAESPAYQQIVVDRHAASDGLVLLAEALPGI